MMDKINIKWRELSDKALLKYIGDFIQDARLRQNKTQQEVAIAAGINRSTLIHVEKGNGGTLLTLLQVLRVLDQLQVLQPFEVQTKISPLQLAKMAQNKRQRAGKSVKQTNNTELKTDW